jgi:hypothetical protein
LVNYRLIFLGVRSDHSRLLLVGVDDFLYARLIIFIFGLVTVCLSRQLLLYLLDSLEGEVVLCHILELLDVVLDVVHGHVKARVDKLVVNLFEKFRGLGFLPNLETEWHIR